MMANFKASVNSTTAGPDPEILGVVVLAVDGEGMWRAFCSITLHL